MKLSWNRGLTQLTSHTHTHTHTQAKDRLQGMCWLVLRVLGVTQHIGNPLKCEHSRSLYVATYFWRNPFATGGRHPSRMSFVTMGICVVPEPQKAARCPSMGFSLWWSLSGGCFGSFLPWTYTPLFYRGYVFVVLSLIESEKLHSICRDCVNFVSLFLLNIDNLDQTGDCWKDSWQPGKTVGKLERQFTQLHWTEIRQISLNTQTHTQTKPYIQTRSQIHHNHTPTLEFAHP